MSMHVYPAREIEHRTDGLDCWCNPTYRLPCDECDDGCWKCVDGMITLTREEAEHADAPLVIVHNEACND